MGGRRHGFCCTIFLLEPITIFVATVESSWVVVIVFAGRGSTIRFQPASRIAGISIYRSWNLRFVLLHQGSGTGRSGVACFFATSGILKSYKRRAVLLQRRHVELAYLGKKTTAVPAACTLRRARRQGWTGWRWRIRCYNRGAGSFNRCRRRLRVSHGQVWRGSDPDDWEGQRRAHRDPPSWGGGALCYRRARDLASSRVVLRLQS